MDTAALICSREVYPRDRGSQDGAVLACLFPLQHREQGTFADTHKKYQSMNSHECMFPLAGQSKSTRSQYSFYEHACIKEFFETFPSFMTCWIEFGKNVGKFIRDSECQTGVYLYPNSQESSVDSATSNIQLLEREPISQIICACPPS